MNKVERDNLIVDGIKTLLDESPLYGNIIMNLSRESNSKSLNALSLKWQNHRWFLIINPDLLTKRFANHRQIALALAHEALHVIWQHPLRYAEQRQQINQAELIDLGTDLAVNQYLPEALGKLPGAITLQTIFDLYGKLLPEYEDSSVYIDHMSTLLKKKSIPSGNNIDGHGDWQNMSRSETEARSALNRVIKKADEDTKRSGRGFLPGVVRRQVDEVNQPRRNWRAILRVGLSQVPDKKQDSRARFNRRQPYRLDLAGEVSSFSTQLAIFIDNSASISDQEAGKMIATVLQIIKQFDADMHVFSFDTQVQEVQKINDWSRHTGGGTTFQSIFDKLAQEKFDPARTVVVILTDGDGEKKKLQTKFRRVYWLLPRGKKLSISQPFGKIETM